MIPQITSKPILQISVIKKPILLGRIGLINRNINIYLHFVRVA